MLCFRSLLPYFDLFNFITEVKDHSLNNKITSYNVNTHINSIERGHNSKNTAYRVMPLCLTTWALLLQASIPSFIIISLKLFPQWAQQQQWHSHNHNRLTFFLNDHIRSSFFLRNTLAKNYSTNFQVYHKSCLHIA